MAYANVGYLMPTTIDWSAVSGSTADVAEADLAHPADAVRAGEVEAAGACEEHLQTGEKAVAY